MVSLKEPLKKAVSGPDISCKRAKAERRAFGIASKITLLLLGILLIRSIPDIIRYIKIELM